MSENKKIKKPKPLSRRSITCGVCSKVLERSESLKPHFEKFHEGKPPFEKGQKQLEPDIFRKVRKRTVTESENNTISECNLNVHQIPKKVQEDEDTYSRPLNIDTNYIEPTNSSPIRSPPLFCPPKSIQIY